MAFIVDCICEGNLNCWHDFDLARENLFDVNGKTVSDTVFFENIILTDYFESKGNRVLSVDDVIIEVQKKSVKDTSDLNKIVSDIFKKGEKTLLLTVINKNNQRNYLGVKIN